MALVSALFTMIYIGVNAFLFVTNLLLPLPIVIVDAILLVFWLISMSGFGSSGFLKISCTYTINYGFGWGLSGTSSVSGTSRVCQVSKTIFGFSFLVL